MNKEWVHELHPDDSRRKKETTHMHVSEDKQRLSSSSVSFPKNLCHWYCCEPNSFIGQCRGGSVFSMPSSNVSVSVSRLTDETLEGEDEEEKKKSCSRFNHRHWLLEQMPVIDSSLVFFLLTSTSMSESENRTKLQRRTVVGDLIAQSRWDWLFSSDPSRTESSVVRSEVLLVVMKRKLSC